MQKKYNNNKKNIFGTSVVSGLCFIIFFLSATFSRAAEVQLPGLASNATLPTYIAYFFKLGVYLTIFIAVLSFAIGGIGLIMSGGNAGLEKESKDRMKGSAFGLALAVIAFLILKTINPAIATPALSPLPAVSSSNNGPGVYFTDNTTYAEAPQSVAGSDIPTKLNNIKYICNNSGGPNIIVWQYQNTDFTGLKKSSIISCGNSTSVDAASLQWDYEKPGIYLCQNGCNSDDTCQGLMSTLINNDKTPTCDPNCSNNWGRSGGKGIRFVNDVANNIYYGTVLTTGVSLVANDYEHSGSCTFPIMSKFKAVDCEDKDIKNNSIDASNYLSLAFITMNNNATSKIGVNFYSNPNGWTTDNHSKLTAGIYNSKITSQANPFLEIDPSQMCYNYSNSITPTSNQYKCGVNHNNFCGVGNKMNCSTGAVETVQDRIGSLQINNGENYLVAMYSGINYSNGTLQPNIYCQIFRGTVPNFNAITFPQYYNPLTDIYVIRTK